MSAEGIVDLQEARLERAAKARKGRAPGDVERMTGRHRWAIAAGLAAALVTGALIGTRLELGSPSSGSQLAAVGEERADHDHAPGSGALFRDGFDSGGVGSWSTARVDEQPNHR